MPSTVTSMGVATDKDFEEALYSAIREKVASFGWPYYGFDCVAETLGDAEDWIDDLASDIVDAVETTTASWKEMQ